MASILERYGWHEWLSKSNFSFLIGASHPRELITRAIALGYSSLCINDFDGAYGLARAHLELKHLKKDSPTNKDFSLNFGAEIHFKEDHQKPILLQESLVLVAQSWQGYHQLCQILSYTHRHGKHNAFITQEDLLKFCVDDLVAIQPMRGAIRRGAGASFFAPLCDHFKQRFYFAISRHLHVAEDYWIPQTLDIAKHLGRQCLLSQDVFFHSYEKKRLSDVLHCIRNNVSIDEGGQYFFPNCERYLQRLAALEARFSGLDCYQSSLAASQNLADSCRFDMASLRYHYPKEMIPDGYHAQEFLQELSWKGAKDHYGTIPTNIIQTIEHELKLISQLQFADYFLTVWDIVTWARQRGILCQGRGSAANSAVCFVLGITSVNPNTFNLLFERFISAERGDPPDIDVDFEHERREEVIQYIYERYGRKKAAMVANIITFRKKGALRAVGKALGISDSSIDLAAHFSSTKHLRSQTEKEIITAVRHELIASKETEQDWANWADLAAEIKGFPRHMGIHSGGFMIADKALDWLVPQEPASMPGRTVIQWCKDDIEGLGFFKIDILALGMLSALRKCFADVKSHYKETLNLHSIPTDDPKTYAMIQKADTVGTFQIESRAQMSMLPRLRPACFYDLVIEIAIIRPGPIQGKVINPYLRRRAGIDSVHYPSPVLRPILERTLGIAIFQEQAMRIAIELGNFTAGEADELRKSIGAWSIKDPDRDLNPYLEKLAAGMKENAYQEDFIEQIIAQMRGFAHYGFPESHAVSFALIAYASNYVKCHYPAAFFTSVLNSQPMGFYSPHALIQAAIRDQVVILPICINYSNWDHQLEEVKTQGTSKAYGIRIGLRLLKALRKQAALQLISKRSQSGIFSTIKDFFDRVPIYRPDLSALAAANAFHSLNLSRFEALWASEAALCHPLLEDEEERVNWRQEDEFERMQRDFDACQISLADHPSRVVKLGYWCYQPQRSSIKLASELNKINTNTFVLVFGMLLIKQAPPSAKGMVFLTLEDESGFINLAFSPPVYALYHRSIERDGFICVKGRLQKVNDYHSILVSELYPRQAKLAEVTKIKRGKSKDGLFERKKRPLI